MNTHYLNLEKQIIISSTSVIRLILNTLKEIDPRLADHGERVAFIIYKMLENQPQYSKVELKRAFILGLFHDIGAYKTEEINNLFELETSNIEDHSIYGYLFIKYFTPIGDYAQSILYHHAKAEIIKSLGLKEDYALYANLIHFADRVDVFMQSATETKISEMFVSFNKVEFSDTAISLFIEANKDNLIIDSVRDGSYIKTLHELIDKIESNIDINISFLETLPYLIDFRSPFTVTHTAATVSISTTLADLFELSEEQKTQLYYAALLHDVGKIAIPIDILESSGKLNGTGYPRGLCEDELNIQDRILAVSDIASALLGVRSYKEPFSPQKSIDILKKMADKGEISSSVVSKFSDNITTVISKSDKAIRSVINSYDEINSRFKTLKTELQTLV